MTGGGGRKTISLLPRCHTKSHRRKFKWAASTPYKTCDLACLHKNHRKCTHGQSPKRWFPRQMCIFVFLKPRLPCFGQFSPYVILARNNNRTNETLPCHLHKRVVRCDFTTERRNTVTKCWMSYNTTLYFPHLRTQRNRWNEHPIIDTCFYRFRCVCDWSKHVIELCCCT